MYFLYQFKKILEGASNMIKFVHLLGFLKKISLLIVINGENTALIFSIF